MRPLRLLRRLLVHRTWRWGVLAGALALVVVLWVAWPYLWALGDIRAGREHQPSRLYAQARELAPGIAASPELLVRHLRSLGYEEAAGEAVGPGQYSRRGARVIAHLRERPTADGLAPAAAVEVAFAEGEIALVTLAGGPVDRVLLDAPLLASDYGPGTREVMPVRLAELPPHVIDAVLAAEDAGFFRHLGVSPSGIARAAWVNLREGEVEQGGSTITQQLVKNVFLTHQRSLVRKAREAALALAVELQHSKEDILQAYLNQIYLGTAGGVNVHGIGAAARTWFGKDADRLDVAEAATLAGMIRLPGPTAPNSHPERARERRDLVLRRMAELERIDEETLQEALARPLEVDFQPPGRRQAPWFAALVAEEARQRFGIRTLGDRGQHLFSTLELGEQLAAEGAVAEGLAALGDDDLEAALVSVEPASGALRAYVGGRDWGRSQFDRVRQARRQAGSAFKPVVLVAALESREVSNASRLRDEPLVVRAGGRDWSPANDDGRFRGEVTVRSALEESRNVPVARLALDVGLRDVARTARRLGIESRMEEVPSLALGAFEVTPREMATLYATLAAGGRRPPLHGLVAALDAAGRPLEPRPLAEPEEVLDPRIAWMTGSVLQGVVARGTGRGLARYGVARGVAAKTGTSNQGRDSWFAGYRSDRAVVVWVGRDDAAPTRLSGARAALPIWGRFVRDALASAPPPSPEPPGLAHQTVCRVSGRLPRAPCPRLDEVFLPGQEPTALCDVHRIEPRPWERLERPLHRARGWLRRKLEEIF